MRTAKEYRAIMAKITPPPTDSVFTLRKVTEIILPHPFHITAKHMKNSRGMHLEADSAPCGYPGCNLKADEHKTQLTLFIRVPSNRDLNAIAGLHDYLLAVKTEAEALGIEGFAFPDKDPERIKARVISGSMGCSMCPPDHPNHFYELRDGVGRDAGGCSLDHVLEDEYYLEHLEPHVLAQVREIFTKWDASKPPLDHPRTIAWMQHVYAHLAHCYTDDEQKAEPFEYGKPATVIYPVPYYKLRHFHDDPRFSDTWRETEMRSVNQANDEIKARYSEVCTPDNHAAVRYIRKYYPEHTPRLDWIGSPPKNAGNWYEKLTERPKPEDCPGDASVRMKHPVNGSWCQFCGWHAEEEKKTA